MLLEKTVPRGPQKMLEPTMQKLATMYEKHPQRGSDGLLHELDSMTKISIEQGHLLAGLHAAIKPKLSVEIGLAYGFSTLFILDAAFQTNAACRHIAIDPYQDAMWHGIGRQAVKEVNFDSKFEFIQETSVTALTEMHKQGTKADYIYIDGAHTFDYALVDFFCSDRVLNIGGLVIFDDMWMPSIQKLASFIRNNIGSYQEIPTDVKNVFCLRKIKEDDRPWNHFAAF
jgi:predicted O-methyltransferase YrrM